MHVSAQNEPNFQGSNGKFHPNLSLRTPIKTISHHPNEPNQTNIHILSKRDMAMYFNTNIFLLAFFAIAVILFSGNNNNMVVGHGKSCQAEYLQGLISQCTDHLKKNVPKTNPSAHCCALVSKVDLPCLSKQLPKEILEMIDMDKVDFVTKSCCRPNHGRGPGPARD